MRSGCKGQQAVNGFSGPRLRWLVAVAAMLALSLWGSGTVSAASAATLQTPSGCWITPPRASKPAGFPVSGSGFTPSSLVTLVADDGQSHLTTTVGADATGGLIAGLSPLSSTSLTPHMATVMAYASAGQQPSAGAPVASLTVPAVLRGIEVDQSPSPPYFQEAAERALQVGGYPDQTIYAHYYFRPYGVPFTFYGRFVKTVRVGRTSGPCGTLASRMRMFGQVRPRVGGWAIVIDDRKRHSTRPATQICFQVSQWWGGRPPIPSDPHPGLYLIGPTAC